jgi:hypothetical protein
MTRHLRRRTAQGLLALLAGLWLLAATAPCVMAAPHCPHGMSGDCPSMEHAGQSAAGDCDALTAVDCQSADQEQLAATTPVMDFSVVPVRLHGLPAVAVLRTPHTPDRYATVILSPPLNLQHAVLLI